MKTKNYRKHNSRSLIDFGKLIHSRMGRYAKKRQGSAEVAAAAGKKRILVSGGESETSTASVQLETTLLVVKTPENIPANSGCESSSSGNILSDLEEDAEVNAEHIATSGVQYSVDSRDRRENTPTREAEAELESTTATPCESSNSRPRCSSAEKMPTEAELEEFFAAAEENLHKQFIDKYNYDTVKDEPLDGRYEWVPIHQPNRSADL